MSAVYVYHYVLECHEGSKPQKKAGVIDLAYPVVSIKEYTELRDLVVLRFGFSPSGPVHWEITVLTHLHTLDWQGAVVP